MTNQEQKQKRREYVKNNKALILEINRRYRFNNQEKIKRESKKWRDENVERTMIHHSRARAKKLGLSFDLTLQDIIVPPLCPLLNIPLSCGNKSLTDNSPTLDRLDSAVGYVKGNVRVISHLANRMKNKATKEQLLTFAKNIEAYFNN